MNNYEVYLDIEKRIRNCNHWTKTREGGLIVAIVCQRIKDSMGLLRADRVKPGNSKQTHQEIAIDWFRAKEHFHWCDLVEVEPTWINWLIRNKGGVQL